MFQRRFTVNGSFIPQDADGNDMCILFIKYGRCRFKQKCKKSHWIPPLPDEPYPVKLKPPLPNDGKLCENRNDIEPIKPSCLCDKTDSCLSETLTSSGCQRFSLPSNVRKIKTSSLTSEDEENPTIFPRRFKHVFHDCHDDATEYFGVKRLFYEAGAHINNLTEKLHILEPPVNKIEKRHLKILRRIHWRNIQKLKEKLSQYPPSFNLKFNRNKIDFTRLKPYIYLLVHECFCVGSLNKPVKPSPLHFLITDTLVAYLERKFITALEAEKKLQYWGARAVRARHCIAHLWHVMALSSRSPDGCAEEIVDLEQEVLDGKRTSLDYAFACSFSLKRVLLQVKMVNNYTVRRRTTSSVKLGLEAQQNVRLTKFDGSSDIPYSFLTSKAMRKALEKEEHTLEKEEHALEKEEHTLENEQHTLEKEGHTLRGAERQGGFVNNKINCAQPKQQKRRRSRQFKNISLSKRKSIEVELLSKLNSDR